MTGWTSKDFKLIRKRTFSARGFRDEISFSHAILSNKEEGQITFEENIMKVEIIITGS